MNSIRVRVNGGLSVLSAFANCHGAAFSIELPMIVEVSKSDIDKFSNDSIKRTVDFTRKLFDINDKFIIDIKSIIPEANGLKSSSAMTLSIILGILKIENINFNDHKLLKIAAQASKYNNTSITGAFDDLCSIYYGGFCYTDNKNMKIIRRSSMDYVPIAIAYSSKNRLTRNIKKIDFKNLSKKIGIIENLIRNGMIFDAMEMNGYLYGSILGADYNVISYFLESGAIYSSQSGKGPAIYAIFNDNRTRKRALDNFNLDYNIIRTRPSNRGITYEYNDKR